MKKIVHIITLMLLVTLTSCQEVKTRQSSVKAVNISLSEDEFESKLSQNKGVQLIDVRSPEEFAEGHLKGALNYNVNSADFENKVAGLDKSKPVLVYCLSGGRSAYAANVLAGKGFSEIYNLAGGMVKWNAENKPV